MKTIIFYLYSAGLKSIFFCSIYLTLSFYSSLTAKQAKIHSREYSEINKPKSCLYAYNKNNYKIILNEEINYFIVIKNNKYCINCFTSLNDYVRAIKTDLKARFIVISLCDSTVLARKRMSAADNELMPDFDEHYLQYKNENNNTIFDSLKTNYTPEIIIISRGELTYIPNESIFEHPSLNIKPQIQFEINEKLK